MRTPASSRAVEHAGRHGGRPVAGAAGAGRRGVAGRGLADRRHHASAVVGRVELEAGHLQRHGAASPGEHLERERRTGHVLLDHDLVTAALQLAPRGVQLGRVVGDDHALAAAGRARLDHGREAAGRPVARPRDAELGEQAPRGQLGRRHAVRVEVEQQRHVPRRDALGEPRQRGLVLAGRQHGVAGGDEAARARLVGGHVGDHVHVGEAGGRRRLAPVHQHRLPAGLGGQIGGLRALQLAADDQEAHAVSSGTAADSAAIRSRYSSTPAGTQPQPGRGAAARRARCGSPRRCPAPPARRRRAPRWAARWT